jgi:hypothetical protein
MMNARVNRSEKNIRRRAEILREEQADIRGISWNLKMAFYEIDFYSESESGAWTLGVTSKDYRFCSRAAAVIRRFKYTAVWIALTGAGDCDKGFSSFACQSPEPWKATSGSQAFVSWNS